MQELSLVNMMKIGVGVGLPVHNNKRRVQQLAKTSFHHVRDPPIRCMGSVNAKPDIADQIPVWKGRDTTHGEAGERPAVGPGIWLILTVETIPDLPPEGAFLKVWKDGFQ
jgi:hypothetical protein